MSICFQLSEVFYSMKNHHMILIRRKSVTGMRSDQSSLTHSYYCCVPRAIDSQLIKPIFAIYPACPSSSSSAVAHRSADSQCPNTVTSVLMGVAAAAAAGVVADPCVSLGERVT